MKFKYPVYKPSLYGNEKKYLAECIDDNWLTENGRFVFDFENEFAKRISARYATATANGTLALHLALVTLGIGQGDEVLVPTLTYIATANAVTYTGAKAVFVDSEPNYWQISTDDIINKITNKTRAIIPVHLYGHPCDMDKIMTIAREYNLFVIEDAAEGFGTYYKNQHVGTFGDIGIFSFYGNKTITTGEGGMLVTNDVTLLEKSIKYKGQGLAMWKQYWHDWIGYNYRITNICAAIGLAQLEQADKFLNQKRKIANWYHKLLEEVPVEHHAEAEYAHHSYWMVTIITESDLTREELREHLAENGIETRPVFFPIHTMPIYPVESKTLKIAESIAFRGINLPSYPSLNKSDVEFICATIKQYFEKK